MLDYKGKIVIDGRRIEKAKEANIYEGVCWWVEKQPLLLGASEKNFPITKAQLKEVLPVMDRPVIQHVLKKVYYTEIRDVLIITNRNKR
jgi:hypothetical protein